MATPADRMHMVPGLGARSSNTAWSWCLCVVLSFSLSLSVTLTLASIITTLAALCSTIYNNTNRTVKTQFVVLGLQFLHSWAAGIPLFKSLLATPRLLSPESQQGCADTKPKKIKQKETIRDLTRPCTKKELLNTEKNLPLA